MLLTQEDLHLLKLYQPNTLPADTILQAAVAVILREGESGTECLMMQRAQHKNDPWSGQMGFPGGKIDSSDASQWHAAVRETQEEVSIVLTQADYLGRIDDVYGIKVNQQFNVHIASFVFKPATLSPPVGNHEVADLVWLPLSRLQNSRYAITHSHPMKPSLRVPAIRINNNKQQVLWGLSLRIVLSLFHAVKKDATAFTQSDRQSLCQYLPTSQME